MFVCRVTIVSPGCAGPACIKSRLDVATEPDLSGSTDSKISGELDDSEYSGEFGEFDEFDESDASFQLNSDALWSMFSVTEGKALQAVSTLTLKTVAIINILFNTYKILLSVVFEQ